MKADWYIALIVSNPKNKLRTGKCKQDNIFTIGQIVDKTIKIRQKIDLGFTVIDTAFDIVPRWKLWNILINRGLSRKLISSYRKEKIEILPKLIRRILNK